MEKIEYVITSLITGDYLSGFDDSEVGVIRKLWMSDPNEAIFFENITDAVSLMVRLRIEDDERITFADVKEDDKQMLVTPRDRSFFDLAPVKSMIREMRHVLHGEPK